MVLTMTTLHGQCDPSHLPYDATVKLLPERLSHAWVTKPAVHCRFTITLSAGLKETLGNF